MQGKQLRFGLFGAVQGGGELLGGVEFAGARGVGEGVALAQPEVVEIARREVEGRLDAQVFFGQEPRVEAIEQDRLVASVGDQVFPSVIAQPWGFDDDDPWAEAAEVHAAQDGFFVAFDVYLQKMYWPIGSILFADGGQCAGFDGEAAHVHAEVFALLGDGWVRGGEAGAGDAVEGDFARLVAGDALHGGIARALLAQRVVVILHRLDVDAVPAVIVEGFGDRVVARVIGADIDVETVFELLECAPPYSEGYKVLQLFARRS